MGERTFRCYRRKRRRESENECTVRLTSTTNTASPILMPDLNSYGELDCALISIKNGFIFENMKGFECE